MCRYFCLITLSLWLLGCQSSNPYQAESLPLPAAPANTATHIDLNSEPATATGQDYTYWCWSESHSQPALADYPQQTAQHVLAEQLEQYGLRPAHSNEQCELQVQLSSQHSSQTVRYDYYDYPSAYYGYGHGRSHPFYDRYRYSGLGLNIPITPRSYTEYYQQLNLSFTDAHTGLVIWRGHNTLRSVQNAQTSAQALRQAINSMLNDYF